MIFVPRLWELNSNFGGNVFWPDLYIPTVILREIMEFEIGSTEHQVIISHFYFFFYNDF